MYCDICCAFTTQHLLNHALIRTGVPLQRNAILIHNNTEVLDIMREVVSDPVAVYARPIPTTTTLLCVFDYHSVLRRRLLSHP
jgi:hypothetical protein